MGGLSLVGGLGSSIASGIQAKQSANAAEREYAKQSQFLDNWFNKQYYSDITKRTDVQNMMRLLQENQEKQAKRDDAIAAVSGATPEAQLAAQSNRNKSYADAMAEIASNASQLKDSYLQNYQNQRMNLINPKAGLLQQSSQAWGQAGANLFSSGAKLLGSGIDSILGKDEK